VKDLERANNRRSKREVSRTRSDKKKAPGKLEEQRERTPSPVKYGMDADTEERVSYQASDNQGFQK
jgi:hypothetical protein